MLVQELIEELAKLPSDSVVMVEYGDPGYYSSAQPLTDLSASGDGEVYLYHKDC